MTVWPVVLPEEVWRPWKVPVDDGSGLAWTFFSYLNGEVRAVFEPFEAGAAWSLAPEDVHACRIVHPGKGLSFAYQGPCEDERTSFFVVENSAWIASLRGRSCGILDKPLHHFVVVTPSGRLDLAVPDDELRFEKVNRALFVF